MSSILGLLCISIYTRPENQITNYWINTRELQDNKMKLQLCQPSYFILRMKEETTLQNQEVASIYQSMLDGDHDALYKLQNINLKHRPRFIQHAHHLKAKINTEQKTQKQSIQNQQDLHEKVGPPPSEKKDNKPQQPYGVESRFQANLNKLKEEMYMNILKKGPKLQTILKNQNRQHHLRQRRWINSSNNKQENIIKDRTSQQSLHKEKQSETEFSIEIKPNISTQLAPHKNNKIHALAKFTKPSELPKVQSSNIESSKNNITDVQKSHVTKRSKKVQKVDFKEMITKSKKQKMQLQQKNEEQLDFQLKLVEFHRQTKQKIDLVRNKYGLNFNNGPKYLKKKKKGDESSPELRQSESSEKLSPFKVKYQNEKAKCQQHYSDINHLKLQFNNNVGLLARLEVAINNNTFNRYYKTHSDQIYEQDEAEQEDTVEPLLTSQQKNDKYTKLMAHTRDKKWGLMQRTQYESQRAEQLHQSRKTGINSRVTVGQEQKMHYLTSKQNKVTVNERLKMLLFS